MYWATTQYTCTAKTVVQAYTIFESQSDNKEIQAARKASISFITAYFIKKKSYYSLLWRKLRLKLLNVPLEMRHYVILRSSWAAS